MTIKPTYDAFHGKIILHYKGKNVRSIHYTTIIRPMTDIFSHARPHKNIGLPIWFIPQQVENRIRDWKQ